jgi:threonine synthase
MMGPGNGDGAARDPEVPGLLGLVGTRDPRPDGGIPVSLSHALVHAIPPGGGLWVPRVLPSPGAEVAGASSLSHTAMEALTPWLGHPGDARLRAALGTICDEAFRDPIPLVPLEEGAALMELFHGPTAAFKDFAARFLAAALQLLDAPRHILVATSGDTGSAVAAAFAGRPGFRVTVLFPARGVSSRQAHLLSCFGDAGNVASYQVRGSFDQAQAMVKALLSDREAVARHGLASANSISPGRLLPQMTWFAHHARDWVARTGRRPGFIIPTGNLGHGVAAIWARAMGFPLGPIHLATNRNPAVVRWLETRDRGPHPTLSTPANAMDVGTPSNLERLAWQYLDPVANPPEGISASATSDAEILAMVAEAPRRWGQVVCPHTACGLHALRRLREGGSEEDWIVAATAHPAKFPEVVEPRVGGPVPLPPALEEWLDRPARAGTLPPNTAALLAELDRGG